MVDARTTEGDAFTGIIEVPDAPPGTRLAPAPTRQAAFDWSLTLASQRIENTIVYLSGARQWGVFVPEIECARAGCHIELFCREMASRPKHRPPSKLKAGAIRLFHPALIFWSLFLIAVHWSVEAANADLKALGVMDSVKASSGEWFRLFSAVTLHADVDHLVSNLVGGFLFVSAAATQWGVGVALLLSYCAGVMGNLLGWWMYEPPHQSLGASGMVFGALGLCLATPFFRVSGTGWRRRAVAATVMLFALFGLNPASDIVAHVGGLLGGATIGWVALLLGRSEQKIPEWVDALAMVVLGFAILGPWLMAFRWGL